MKKEKMKKLKEVGFKYKGRQIKVKAEDCNELKKVRGLMFRRREKANTLVFDFGEEVKEPIHSFFVFFPFVAVWLDGKGKVVALKKVRPFRFYILPKKKFKKLVEIPINKRYRSTVKFLVGD